MTTAAGVSGVAHAGSQAAATREADAKSVGATDPVAATDGDVDADGAGAGLHAATRQRTATLMTARVAHRRPRAVSGSLAINP